MQLMHAGDGLTATTLLKRSSPFQLSSNIVWRPQYLTVLTLPFFIDHILFICTRSCLSP